MHRYENFVTPFMGTVNFPKKGFFRGFTP